GGRGGGVAGSIPVRSGECVAGTPQGRGRLEGRADQEAQAEGRRVGPRPRCAEGGEQRPPFSGDDVRRVRQARPQVSERRACRILAVARSGVRRRARQAPRRGAINEPLAARIADLIRRHPTFGYRRLWALLRFREGTRITPKTVYRICRLKGWFVHQRATTPRPRAQGRRRQAVRSNERRATDVTHVYRGQDGSAHRAAVIDCHDRELIGHEFALRGRAKEAERALEEAVPLPVSGTREGDTTIASPPSIVDPDRIERSRVIAHAAAIAMRAPAGVRCPSRSMSHSVL